MPVKIELSWHDARKCWKKYYLGKHHYVGKGQCKGKSDMEGYRIALAEWDERKRELDRLHALRQLSYGQHVHAPATESTSDPLDLAATMATSWGKVGAKPGTSALARTLLLGTRIRPLAEDFIKVKKTEMGTGTISPKMYIQYKDKLEDFVAWTEHADIRVLEATRINANVLADYRNRQLELMAESKDGKRGHSAWTVKKRLNAVVQFVRWLYRHELIDTLPRNLDADFASVPVPKPNPKFFTPEEIRTVFNTASQRTKLYIALGLNCGYRQTDIATLQHDHVDWEKGIIDRLRHKTNERQVHKLWPVTLDLLKREKSEAGTGTVLVSEEGTSLYRDWISDDGKFKFVDVIRLAFDRAMKSSGMDTEAKKDARRFETFRDTGANTIEREFQDYPHLASQYLAHREEAMKVRYVERHFDLLFKALDRLDEVFKLQL